MRETHFINQNKEKWDDFERMLQQKDGNPDKMSELFVQVTDDLSYSRTFYPNRSVRVYLNNVAQSIFLTLYKNKKGKRGRLVDFWTDELPRILFESRKALLLAFVVFALFMGVGSLSSIYDPDFPEFIMGPGYIKHTEENIAKGDPMGIYKSDAEDLMFLRITINNIWVSFLTFIMGVFASVGTVFVLIKNAIMVGAFQQYFFSQGLWKEFFFTVWVHGTMEISAIILAGGAGLVFGSGLIIPGTYSRGQAFIQSARKGLKIIVGIVPLFIIAGFIESFITRYTEAPIVFRAGIMLASLGFVLFYYVYYPWKKSQTGFKSRYTRDEIAATRQLEIDWGRIRSVGDVIAETFSAVVPFIGKFMVVGVVAGMLYGAMSILLFPNKMGFRFNFSGEWFYVANFYLIVMQVGNLIHDIFQTYDLGKKTLFLPVNILFWAALLLLGSAMSKKMRANDFNSQGLWAMALQTLRTQWLGLLLVSAIISVVLSFSTTAWFGLLFPAVFILIGSVLTMATEGKNIFAALGRTLGLLKGNILSLLGIYAIILLLMFLFVSLFCSLLFSFYLESIQLIFDFSIESLILVTDFFTCVLAGFIVSVFVAVVAAAAKLFLQSCQEVNEAPDLLERVNRLGSKKKVYGFEQEV